MPTLLGPLRQISLKTGLRVCMGMEGITVIIYYYLLLLLLLLTKKDVTFLL